MVRALWRNRTGRRLSAVDGSLSGTAFSYFDDTRFGSRSAVTHLTYLSIPNPLGVKTCGFSQRGSQWSTLRKLVRSDRPYPACREDSPASQRSSSIEKGNPCRISRRRISPDLTERIN